MLLLLLALLLMRLAGRLQLCPYQSLRNLRGAALLSSICGGPGRRGVRIGDAGCEGASRSGAGSGAPRWCLVQIVCPFAVDVARALAGAFRGCGALLWASVSR